ncbi:MAG TPA: peptide deformylase [candidate division Zixibacteria bacterium]|nr:peptide deformylase [candidate division Zixibacteria bacterium]
MAVRPIVIYGDPVLREVSEKVENFDKELKNLVSNMVDTLKEAQGLGLAAVQIGVTKRVFIVDLSAVDITEKLRIFVNPEILDTSDESEYEEGCLSFPGIYQKITRPGKVKIKAFDIDGNAFELDITGLAARAILHEYDHLDGELFIDHMSTMTKTMLKGRLKKLQTTS